MLLNLLRWFRGYVLFEIDENLNNHEKIISKILKNNIILWDLKKSENNFYAKISITEYNILNKFLYKFNIKTKILKQHGWPFFISKYKNRLGLLIGAILYSLILWVLSLYIWKIEIYGNEDISRQEIISVIKNLDINYGTLKSKINSYLIKQEIMSKLNNISWISINIQGSRMEILIKEKIKTPEIINQDLPCDIISKCEGHIERIENFNGTSLVKPGDSVTKNQILISSTVQNGDNILQVHADGRVFAKTKRVLYKKTNPSQIMTKNTGKTIKIYKINIFNKEFILNPWSLNKTNEPYKITQNTKNLNILNIILTKNIYLLQEYEEKNLTEQESYDNNIKNIINYEMFGLKNTKILSKKIENYQENNNYVTKITYNILENIAKKQNL